MHLKSIELKNFRNFLSAQFEFCSGLNVFFGPNACGKTNLLEAIHVLSNLRSFRTHIFRELIRWSAVQAYVRGQIYSGNQEQGTLPTKALAVEISPGARVPVINSKQCKTSREYLRTFPSTTFVPDDLNLIKGAPASRRYFLDKGTFHFYPPYWSLLTDYNKILRQKNAFLRNLQQKGKPGREKSLPETQQSQAGSSGEVWNTQLQAIGSKIIVRRIEFVRNIQRLVKDVYGRWLGAHETIDVHYKSSLGLEDKVGKHWMLSEHLDVEQLSHYIFEHYGQTLDRYREREQHLGTAVIGPHRDDLVVKLYGKVLRSYGSQGQQRTAVLALKLAEIHLYAERHAEYPILLLDDVSSELDVYRHKGFFECLQQGMQIFITSTSKPENVASYALPVRYFDLSEYRNKT